MTLALGLLSPSSLRAESLEKLDAILTEAQGVDDFLARPELIERYYKALAKFYGPEKTPREAYDAILAQMRKTIVAAPELKARLWETAGLGQPISFTTEGRVGKPQLDSAAWARFRDEWRHQLAFEAKPYLDIPDADARVQKLRRDLQALDERVKTELKSWAGLKRRAQADRASTFFNQFKQDPQLRAALAFFTHSGLEAEPIRDAFASTSPELILFHLDRLKKSPELLRPDVEIPSSLRSILAERMHKPKTLAERNILTSGDPIPFAAFSKKETWELRPLPRRFHGVFKGIPESECLGGDCAYMRDLTPDRWATIALDNSALYLPYREGEYAGGFLHTVPVRVGERTYTSLDLLSSVLTQSVLVKDPSGSGLRPQSLIRHWYTEAMRALPPGSGGYVIADSDAVNNYGLVDTLRRSSVFLEGKPIGRVAPDVRTLDQKMERGIVGTIPKTPVTARYSNDRMIYEASVRQAKQLVLLAPPDADPPLLDDPNWVRSVFAGDDLQKQARVWMAVNRSELTPEVAKVMQQQYDATLKALQADPRSPQYHDVVSYFSGTSSTAVRGMHRIGYQRAKNPRELLKYFGLWHGLAAKKSSNMMESLRAGNLLFMEEVASEDFFRHHPSAEDLWAARYLPRTAALENKLMDELAERARTPQEYMKIALFLSDAGESQRAVIAEFIDRSFDRYLALRPTPSELLTFLHELGPKLGLAPPPALVRRIADALPRGKLRELAREAFRQVPFYSSEPFNDPRVVAVKPVIARAFATPEMQAWIPEHLGELDPVSVQVWLDESPKGERAARMKRIFGEKEIPLERLALGLTNYLDPAEGAPKLSPALQKNVLGQFLEGWEKAVTEGREFSGTPYGARLAILKAPALRTEPELLARLVRLSRAAEDPDLWKAFGREILATAPPQRFPELWRVVTEELDGRAILAIGEVLGELLDRPKVLGDPMVARLITRLAQSATQYASDASRANSVIEAQRWLGRLLSESKWAASEYAPDWMDAAITLPLSESGERAADDVMRSLLKSELWENHPYRKDWDQALLMRRKYRSVRHWNPLPRSAAIGAAAEKGADPVASACAEWFAAFARMNPFLK